MIWDIGIGGIILLIAILVLASFRILREYERGAGQAEAVEGLPQQVDTECPQVEAAVVHGFAQPTAGPVEQEAAEIG